MTDTNFVTRAELAESIQMLRAEVQALRQDLNAAVVALTQRLDRHERWLQVLSTGQVLGLLLLIYLVAKLGF